MRLLNVRFNFFTAMRFLIVIPTKQTQIDNKTLSEIHVVWYNVTHAEEKMNDVRIYKHKENETRDIFRHTPVETPNKWKSSEKSNFPKNVNKNISFEISSQ